MILDDYSEGVFSTFYTCFKVDKTTIDSYYLAYYFEVSGIAAYLI